MPGRGRPKSSRMATPKPSTPVREHLPQHEAGHRQRQRQRHQEQDEQAPQGPSGMAEEPNTPLELPQEDNGAPREPQQRPSQLRGIPEDSTLEDDLVFKLERLGYRVQHVMVEQLPFGIEVSANDVHGDCMVAHVRPGSAAEAWGIMPGDFIVSLGGRVVTAPHFVRALQQLPLPFSLSLLRL